MGALAQQTARGAVPAQEAQAQPAAVEEPVVADEQAMSPEDEAAAQQSLDPSQLRPEEPTPEEQEMFTRVERAIHGIVYDDKKAFGAITDMLDTGKDNPVETLAATGLMVFQTVDGMTKGGIPEIILMRSAEVALDYVIKVAEDTGIMEVDEATANQAMKALVTKAGEAYGIDVSEIEAAYSNQAVPEEIRSKLSAGGESGAASAKGAM